MKKKTKNDTKNDYDSWLISYIESGMGLPPIELEEKMKKIRWSKFVEVSLDDIYREKV